MPGPRSRSTAVKLSPEEQTAQRFHRHQRLAEEAARSEAALAARLAGLGPEDRERYHARQAAAYYQEGAHFDHQIVWRDDAGKMDLLGTPAVRLSNLNLTARGPGSPRELDLATVQALIADLQEVERRMKL